MKIILSSLLFLTLWSASYAQDEKRDFTYKFVINKSEGYYKTLNKKYDGVGMHIASSNDYIICEQTGLKGVWLSVALDKLIDIRNNIGMYIHDQDRSAWYIMETLDNIYKGRAKLEDIHETEKVNGYTCHKYKIVSSQNHGTAMPTAENWDYSYTIYVTNDIKADQGFLKYILALLTNYTVDVPLTGVLVKYEFIVTKKDKIMSDVSLVLDKATSTALKNTDVKLPWKDENMRAAVAIQESYSDRVVDGKERVIGAGSRETKMSSIISPWTDESEKEYVTRLKALLLKVTGHVVEKFQHERFSPEM